MIFLKSFREIEIIKTNGKLVAQTVRLLSENLKPGIKTKELDKIAGDFLKKNQAKSAFLGYRGYPANICISIDDEIVHGIPGDRTIEKGQLVSLDVGVYKDGYYADGAATFVVDGVTEEALKLVEVTKAALNIGIQKAKAGNYLGEVSSAIQGYVEENGFSVVRDLVGHGIGKNMHEDPQVPNFGEKDKGPILKPGMVLAIEPMVNAGGYKIRTKPDLWTIATEDGSLSAHFEHTVAITDNGAVVLTSLN